MSAVAAGPAAATRIALCLIGIAAVAGCSQGSDGYPLQPPSTPSRGIVDPASVDDLLAAIAKAGLPVADRRDATGRDCPNIGCVQRVQTDTVTITRFPTSGQAEIYGSAHDDAYQIVDIVLSFAASTPPSARLGYERAVEKTIE